MYANDYYLVVRSYFFTVTYLTSLKKKQMKIIFYYFNYIFKKYHYVISEIKPFLRA